jgi:cellulose biosynthesis protein BcsQ
MTLDNYQIKINGQRELELKNESLVEVLKFYVLFSEASELSFFEYDYEFNNFNYSYSVTKDSKFIKEFDDVTCYDNDISIVLEENDTIYAKICFDKFPGTSDIVQDLFDKTLELLHKRFALQKELRSKESKLDIYIISDEKSKSFATQISQSMHVLLNANIFIESSILSITNLLKEKTKKSILIYTIEDEKLLNLEKKTLETLNEFLVVIGPSDYNLSLFCGHLNVYNYLSKNDFLPEQLKTIIEEISHKVQNKYVNKNKIIALSGIAGGIGTTTISMNIANILAKKNADKNVLYIDLSETKSISNLFLEQNPLPKKTIIDLVNSAEYDIDLNLESGLVKIRENFYSINGIQKHIDGDFLEQEVFIEKFLEYISRVSETFNFIIIDTGEANASILKSTIYDIANELWIITEMSLPHISKLKTFFSLMRRAGLKDKLTFLVNRYNSENAISVSDVTSILNTANEDNLKFDLKIPNDYVTLGHCWNYCELASNTHPKSTFVKKLEEILQDRDFFKEEVVHESSSKSWLSFFK